MIRYEYVCCDCDHRFEEDRKIHERGIPTTLPCPSCEEYAVLRVHGNRGGFRLLGGGWADMGYSNNPMHMPRKGKGDK